MGNENRIGLIVSGNRDMHDSLRQMMAPYPFLLHEAVSGKDALGCCGQVRPDFMVLDCDLPDMDCTGLLMALARVFGSQMPAVLACSSRGDLQQISQVMHGGANECIIKPFNADVLDFKLRLIGAVKGQRC